MPRWSHCRLGILMMLALASVPLAPVPRAGATVVIPLTLSELAAAADDIARGRIVRIDARQTASRRVERLITFEPLEQLKGQLGGPVQFRLPGGTFGRYRTIAVGSPEFREGDEVVLFLGRRETGLPVLLGFHQGVYRIALDAAGQRIVSTPVLQDLPASQEPALQESPSAGAGRTSTAGAPVAGPRAVGQGAAGQGAVGKGAVGQGTPIVRGDEARRPLTWNQFHARVMAAIASGAPNGAARERGAR